MVRLPAAILALLGASSLLLGCSASDEPAGAPEAGQAAADQPARAAPEASQTGQWRSYWVDSFQDSFYTPEGIDRLVADAQAINANVLIVQASRWMDCFCNRSDLPRTHAAIDPDFDPLDEVISKAHAAGIQVHAWVNATPAWNAPVPPEDPDHVLNRHGADAEGWDNWLNVRSDGSSTAGENMRNLDPANPAAVDYVVNGIASIVREYDVDGINLDYIRYPDDNSAGYRSDWGYSEASLDRFRAATGSRKSPDPTDPEFSDWRREQVTNLVRKAYLTMYQIDPEAALSVNGITYWYGPQSEGGWESTRTYTEVLQDWKGWLEEGIIDVNVAMNYKAEAGGEDRIQMFDEWNEVLKDWQAGRYAVVGQGLYVNELDENVAQARRALEPSDAGNTVAGWSGYAYASPSATAAADRGSADAERARLADALTAEDPSGEAPLFQKPADVPEMTWKTQPTQGHIVGELATVDGAAIDQVELTLTHRASGETVTGRLSDGSGWFGFANLEPGEWQISVDLPDGVLGRDTQAVTVAPGEVSEVVFSPLNRVTP